MVLLCNYFLTYKCNLRCSFCDIWQKKMDGKSLHGLREIENNLDDLKRLGVRFIDFTGGEPLLFPHTIEALQAAKHRGFFTTLTTNGVLYPRFARQLNGKVDMMRISLHSRETVQEALEVARIERQKIFLHFVVTDENVSMLPSVCEFALRNRAPVRLAPSFSYFGNRVLAEENIGLIYKALKQPYVYADFAELELTKSDGNSVKSPVCRAVSNTVTISPDNCLLLPCFHRAGKSIEIRNSLFNTYNLPTVSAFKEKEGRFSFCNGCNVYCYLRASFHKKPFSKLFWLRFASLALFAVEWSRPQTL